ncbi:hypothetical protein COUCH_10580 [Couchioplanes caeruleus]|uniref:hypothetical protein n=1 Tax=Couchioplanes caeruleus TaxID=56438 RepID=UPI0020BED5D5|nr:hypothetical protein [Couchioplanes caeruleus]UQU66673.1 hypothetical protein COUCH_10580 [Couchioplanes caeruleus]
MSEQSPDRLWSGIQISKVVAGTLAAVAAAVLGSFLGVAGTLAGAALASVVGSVGTQLFDNSLKRGTQRLQTVAPAFVKAPAAVGTPPVAAATEEEKPSHTVPQEPGRFAIRWKPVLVGAATVFIVAMGAIFAVEAMADRSLSSMTTGHDTRGGSTLTSVFSSDEKKSPSPSPSESPAPEESSAPGTSTTESPEPSATTSTPEPTETTTAPAEPTTEAPQQTDPADPGNQQFDQQEQQQQQDPPTE